MSEHIRLGVAFGCLVVIGLFLPENLREWRGLGRLTAAETDPGVSELHDHTRVEFLGASLPRALFGKASLRGGFITTSGEAWSSARAGTVSSRRATPPASSPAPKAGDVALAAD